MTRESKALDRRRLPLVEPLALRNAFDDVDHDDGAGELLLGDALRGRRADVAGADDGDLVDHMGSEVRWTQLELDCCAERAEQS